MRGYFLTNMYLSSIQCGIQSAHCIHDMFITYQQIPEDPATELLYTWAKDHKTMIVLNGGTSEDLRDFYLFSLKHNNLYPFGQFYEDGIDGALTCVGVILPEEIIEMMKFSPQNNSGIAGPGSSNIWLSSNIPNPEPWQWDLVNRIKGLPLAS